MWTFILHEIPIFIDIYFCKLTWSHMPVYLTYLGITLLHNTKEFFSIPEFPFICQPDPSKESELSSHKNKSVIFPTCHALSYKEKPFPFPLGLAVPADVWCCLPLCSPGPSSLFLCSWLPCASSSHQDSLCWADLWTSKWWEWRGKGRACGRGVEGGEEGPVEKAEREGICHSSCPLPGARCSLL